MRIACSVITFHPTGEQLKNIKYLRTFLTVFVVDNTSDNKGIAWALNQAARQAHDQGYEWLLTLDQDSHLSVEDFDNYVAAFTKVDKTGVAAVVPVVDPLVSAGEPGSQEEVLTAMTSTMLLNLRIWQEVRGFSEQLFIDEVDTEYCLRVKLHGYRVIRLSDVIIPHQPGKAITINTKWGERLVAYHPPSRIYYIVRNFWFLRRFYSNAFPEYIAEKKRNVIQKHKEYLKYHPRKIVSAYHLLRGTLHGMIMRLGR
jgi:rhamnosyltransferase